MGDKSGISYLDSLAEWRGTADFSLEPIKSVLRELQDPQDKVRCIQVAGTNGKGSVCSMIASSLGAAGYKVGLTVSPHLYQINERVVIDGVSLSTELLEEFARRVMEASGRVGVRLSFFEGITAVSFLAFAELGVDFAVLEVGLGGRLDATSVPKNPVASVVVSISKDHEHILGDTLEKISAEKAAIIRGPANAFIGKVHKGLDSIFEDAAEKAGVELKSWNSGALKEELALVCQASISLQGTHQVENATLAAAVARSIGVSDQDIVAGLEGVRWPARLELGRVGEASVLIDCAHNPAGVQALVDYVQSRSTFDEPVIVFGALDTKRWTEMVTSLAEVSSEWIISKPDSARALPPQTIVDYLSGIGITNVKVEPSIEKTAELVKMLPAEKAAVVCGSIYLIGELRAILFGSQLAPIWKVAKRS